MEHTGHRTLWDGPMPRCLGRRLCACAAPASPDCRPPHPAALSPYHCTQHTEKTKTPSASRPAVHHASCPMRLPTHSRDNTQKLCFFFLFFFPFVFDSILHLDTNDSNRKQEGRATTALPTPEGLWGSRHRPMSASRERHSRCGVAVGEN